jgi:hypothetical protein
MIFSSVTDEETYSQGARAARQRCHGRRLFCDRINPPQAASL